MKTLAKFESYRLNTPQNASNPISPLDVRPVAAFADNYIWLIESPRVPGHVVAVDPGDAAPVRAELHRSGASLAAILLTHHHPDHIGGVAELLELGGRRARDRSAG